MRREAGCSFAGSGELLRAAERAEGVIRMQLQEDCFGNGVRAGPERGPGSKLLPWMGAWG